MSTDSIQASGGDYTTVAAWWAGIPSTLIENEAGELADEEFVTSDVSIEGKTGVEMEALTGASVTALTVYDMCKAVSQKMIIKEVKLLENLMNAFDMRPCHP